MEKPEKAIVYEAWECSDDREKLVMSDDYETLWEYKEHLESKLKNHGVIGDVSDIKPQVLDVNLSWERGDPHHTIEVFNNGTLMASGWLVNKHD